MLVLSRRLGEKIEIGDGITVTVLRVSGKSIRLGIEAPDDVAIRRAEISAKHTFPRTPGSSTSNIPLLHASPLGRRCTG